MYIGSTSLQTRYTDDLGALTMTSGCFDPRPCSRIRVGSEPGRRRRYRSVSLHAPVGERPQRHVCTTGAIWPTLLVQRFPFRIVMPQPCSLPRVYERQQL